MAPQIDEVRRRAREGKDHPLSVGSGLLILPLRRRTAAEPAQQVDTDPASVLTVAAIGTALD